MAAPYEAGRGLITLEGPSGMFINPTSATLPQGAFTFQYCIFFPNTDNEIVGNGAMLSYGITDWLELGATGNYIDATNQKEFAQAGPLVRVRLMKDEGWMPQISVGFYGKYGTNFLNQSTGFIAAYKRLPIDEDGVVKSLGLHAGARWSWFHADAAETDSLDGYFGAELQLPARVYVVGEIGTRGETQGGAMKRVPYAFGLQWRLRGVNLSLAMIQRGNDAELGLYSGLAYEHAF